MSNTLPLSIDLVTKRVVYPNDVLVGVRNISLDKGSSYTCPVMFNSGSTTGLNTSVSGFIYSLSQPISGTSSFITSANYSSGCFTLDISSPVLDYIIAGNNTLTVESNIAFSGNGIGYILSPLTTIINNNPSVAPAEEYYPLSNPSGYITGLNTGNFITASQTGNFYPAYNPSNFITGINTGNFITNSQTGNFYPAYNPSNYITGINTGNFVTSSQTGNFASTVALSATGTTLQAEINTLEGVTGSFYLKSNPSGYITGLNTGNFVTTSQTGNFYPRSNPSGYITGINTGNFVTVSQTGNFITNSQTGEFLGVWQLSTSSSFTSEDMAPSQAAVAAYVAEHGGGGVSLPFTVSANTIIAESPTYHEALISTDPNNYPVISNGVSSGGQSFKFDANANPELVTNEGSQYVGFDDNNQPALVSSSSNVYVGFESAGGNPIMTSSNSDVSIGFMNGGQPAFNNSNDFAAVAIDSNENGFLGNSSGSSTFQFDDSYNAYITWEGSSAYLAWLNNTIYLGADVTVQGTLYGDWDGNAIQFAGGFISNGAVTMNSLPTSDPGNAGELWNDSGLLRVSAG